MGTVLRQWRLFLTFPACFCKIHFHIVQVPASLTRSLFTLNNYYSLCVCLISCACYRLSGSEWFSCIVQSVLLQHGSCILYSCGTQQYRNLRSGQKKFGPSSNITSSHWLLKLCRSQHACVKVCCRNGIHIYVSCAIVSLRVCNRCNSRTYCTCTTGTVPSSLNRL